MVEYYIVWNEGCTEGFVTNDKNAVKTATKNIADKSRGYPARSCLAMAFYETYGDSGDEKISTQKVEIETK